MNKSLFHQLEGSAICFKPLDLKDTEAIFHFASDEDVSKFIGWDRMKDVEETEKFIELMQGREISGTHLYASIVLKTTKEIIGTAMIFNFDQEANHAEVGYVFDKKHWGKGYGTECVELMSNFAFETLQLHKLYAKVVDANISSARILEKNGFKLEGQLADHYFIDNRYYDALFWGKIQYENH
ncbi:GNAT family N-acetyltransferase [Rummeliibacillus stabekisii]|uniref:GNAT family N-acetyltransferase n=1 Tax=Rummeliibacillus stabekisii TaxID=241244 RepID=UPI00116F39C7|nr:GNAT family N-acetyltransferase [Rummeliibacillus stabekisii]MBB5170753.1 ribosomal-protein-alanine N-acetyltransferase [Rummeliibacillus stabekisii]GEL06247.1 N-acetyltransferase [Rummeliibacillus stabekisii]